METYTYTKEERHEVELFYRVRSSYVNEGLLRFEVTYSWRYDRATAVDEKGNRIMALTFMYDVAENKITDVASDIAEDDKWQKMQFEYNIAIRALIDAYDQIENVDEDLSLAPYFYADTEVDEHVCWPALYDMRDAAAA